MKLGLSEIIKVTGARLLKGDYNNDLFGFSTDTRTIKSDEIYIPLKGENFDGENFIEKALETGVQGYFTTDENKVFDKAKFVLCVEDTKEAYLQLAFHYKNKLNPYTIAITGSSGKTTVKEMMYNVFKNAGITVKSILNHNNEIGLCQTLSSIDKETKYLIIEMGMRGLGEIELLSKYSNPDIAIIVNAGSAHIGRLGSLLNIAIAKFEITKNLKETGVLISHDNRLIKQINNISDKTIYFSLQDKNLEIIEMTQDVCRFNYKGFEYCLNVGGEHNVQNALSVIEASLFAGLSPEVIAKGLSEFSPIEKRWDVQEIKGLKIINDSYNSNPDSVKAALRTFLEYTKGTKVVVLGDMGELGDKEKEYHEELGIFIDNFECDFVLTVGELAKHINPMRVKVKHFDDKKDVAQFIYVNFDENTNILLKASRFMKFEEIIEELSK